MTLRRALSALSLVALTGAAALAPATAFADDPTTTILGVGSPVSFAYDAHRTASVGIDYQCTTDSDLGASTADLKITIYQSVGGAAADEYTGAADGADTAVCDGTVRNLPVQVEITEGDLFNGPAEADVEIRGTAKAFDVTLTDLPDYEAPSPVSMTANATPEPARKGKKITVKGTIEDADSRPVSKAPLVLEFAKDGGDYRKVKTLTSDKKGKVSTKVKASTSGTFRYRFDGGDDLAQGTSDDDHVDVIPVAKKYKNCTALNKVYPNGVGKKGAVDHGGSVTSFLVDNDTYKKNHKSDRDKDGIACEKV